jgi:hypothetical protein
MKPLPERAHLDHLKKQAKDLLRDYRRGDAEAIARSHAATGRNACSTGWASSIRAT